MDGQPDIWQRVDQHIDQPVSIKLERGQKGGHGWEIKIYAENLRVTYIEGGSNEKQTA